MYIHTDKKLNVGDIIDTNKPKTYYIATCSYCGDIQESYDEYGYLMSTSRCNACTSLSFGLRKVETIYNFWTVTQENRKNKK